MAFCVKQKNRARFGLQTDKFCTFRVMDHNFGSLRRLMLARARAVHWQRYFSAQGLLSIDICVFILFF